MPIDHSRVREQFPILTEWAYLNAASFGPLPACAVEAVEAHYRRRNEKACLDFIDWFSEIESIRARAAALVGADADDIAFVPNCGTALSWLMNGIDWKPGDHILSLSDEFPNNLYFGEILNSRGVCFTAAAVPEGRFSADEFLGQVTGRTRLVLLSAANYSTGLRPPLEPIGAALRERGVLLYVDGTQSVGALPTDVESARIDMLAVHAYKWLCSPTGIGFAYVRPAVREWLEPSVYSWRSHRNWRDVDHLHHGVPELPDEATKYEGGGQNFGGLFAMGAVLGWLETLGAQEVEGRIEEVASATRDVLRRHGATLLYDLHPHYDSPIIAAKFPRKDASALAVELQQRRIAVAARKGNLRVSPHFFNNQDDLEQLDSALTEILGSRQGRFA